MMECSELVEKLTDYLEGALESDDPTRLTDHLQLCYGCQAYVGQVEVTLRLLSSVTAEPLSDEFESDLIAAFRRWTESVSP
jgi:anti-sigma factor RsiW